MKLLKSLLLLSALGAVALSLTPHAFAQNQASPDDRARAIRDLAKRGEDGIAGISVYVDDPALDVRLEAVKRLVEIGGPRTVNPLVALARDNDPEVQIRAADGLVNVYLPGYIRGAVSRSINRAGNSIRAKFNDDADDLVIDGFVAVPEPVIEVLGRQARGGTSMAGRANAARALGILRGQAAIPDLIEALYSKDDQVMYESLVALQKIRDPSAGSEVIFLLNDLAEDVQRAALQTVGILRTTEAAPRVRDALRNARNDKISRVALASLAMIADPADHDLFLQNLAHRDDDLRAAAAEGLARLGDTGDMNVLTQAFNNERDTSPRLAMGFALSAVGYLEMNEYSPLRYLVNTLNRGSFRGVALAYLTELARQQAVRDALYPVLPSASRDEKTGLAIVLARSGDRDSLTYLEAMQNDSDTNVMREAIRSYRNLQSRLP